MCDSALIRTIQDRMVLTQHGLVRMTYRSVSIDERDVLSDMLEWVEMSMCILKSVIASDRAADRHSDLTCYQDVLIHMDQHLTEVESHLAECL